MVSGYWLIPELSLGTSFLRVIFVQVHQVTTIFQNISFLKFWKFYCQYKIIILFNLMNLSEITFEIV